MFRKTVRIGLAAAASLGAIAAAAPAEAQQIDQIITFGDSYADTGNAFRLGYANPDALIIYRTGRFSGGTNYIDTLSNLLGAPVDNYAIGGALASINNTLICFDPVYGAPLCGKGFQYEVDQYVAGGASTLDEHDLVTFSIGGNDARLYQQTGGSLDLAPTFGAGTAQLTNVQVARIVGNGTPTISFIAGDTGRLPEIAGNPAGAAVRSAFSTAYNNTMQQYLAGYAANGSIVHYLDLGRVLDNVAANPSGYGISAIACPGIPNLTCLGNSAGYLFYLDGLHLTSQGFAIVGQYVAAQVTAPLTLQAPSDIGVDVGRAFGRTLSSRMDPSTGEVEGAHVFIVGDGLTAHHGETRGNVTFDTKSYGLTVGGEFGFGSGRVGIAANLSRPTADFGGNQAEVDTKTTQVGAYMGAGLGGGFVQAHLAYGWDKHDIDRRGVVEDMAAKPDGTHWVAGIKGGMLMPMGSFSVGPVVGLDYAKAKVDGYTESGDSALTLNVSSQSYKSMRGILGLELRGALGEDGSFLKPYASAMLEKELSSSNRGVSFSQTASPVIVNNFAFESPSKKIYGRLNFGGKAMVAGAIGVDAGVSMTVGKAHGQETSGQVGVTIGF